MRQFMRFESGTGGNTKAYRSASCWGADGKLRP